jgi:hypothetical protein
MQHVVTDGYGVVGIMQCLSDDAEKQSVLAQLRKKSIIERIGKYVTLPYYFLFITIKFLLTPANKNPLTQKGKASGVKHCLYAKDYSVNEIKKQCKTLNVSFNDFIMTAISVTLKQYFISKGDVRTN